MTWNEAVETMRRRWHIDIDRGDWYGLGVRIGGELHKVAVKLAAGAPALLLSARVCRRRYLADEVALRYNRTVELWSLGLDQDVFVLDRALALDGLREGDLVEAVNALTREAARLRERCVPRAHAAGGVGAHTAFWTQ